MEKEEGGGEMEGEGKKFEALAIDVALCITQLYNNTYPQSGTTVTIIQL